MRTPPGGGGARLLLAVTVLFQCRGLLCPEMEARDTGECGWTAQLGTADRSGRRSKPWLKRALRSRLSAAVILHFLQSLVQHRYRALPTEPAGFSALNMTVLTVHSPAREPPGQRRAGELWENRGGAGRGGGAEGGWRAGFRRLQHLSCISKNRKV